ncbi:DUF4279 domain-containing protein [Methylomonas sp. AM2-LC]|uniref:DUF4279 domain-containing protein n=1 Tax=Methylomonas sp. AM2-LC TaxID=3153301 RepID=UPI0032678251
MDCFVRLKITLGDDNVSDFEELHKFHPDRIWSKGDTRPNTKLIEKKAGCILNSGLEKEASLDQHIEALLLRTKSIADVIKKLSARHTVEVLCSIYADDIPSLYFEKNIVEGISILGANFDIDLYIKSNTA